jgi:hypothetical protein
VGPQGVFVLTHMSLLMVGFVGNHQSFCMTCGYTDHRLRIRCIRLYPAGLGTLHHILFTLVNLQCLTSQPGGHTVTTGHTKTVTAVVNPWSTPCV